LSGFDTYLANYDVPTIHALAIMLGPKQVMSTVGNKNPAQPTRNCHMHPINRPHSFSFGEGGRHSPNYGVIG